MAEPQTTKYGEIQENEIQALQAIYMDEFKEEKPNAGAWNKKGDRKFTLRLRAPSNDDTGLPTVLLHVQLPTTYPKTIPNCQATFDGHLPDKTKKKLTKIVQTKPKELLGSEMIYEIASSIQEVLEDAAAFAQETQDLPALDEERAKQEAEALQRAEEARLLEEKERQEAEAEEARALSELVKQQRSRLLRQRTKSNQAVTREGDMSFGSDVSSKGDFTFDQEIKVKSRENGTIVAFRSITNKSIHSIGQVTKLYTAAPVLNDEVTEAVCPSLALKCCCLKIGKQEVQNLESKLQTLVNLQGHPNVLQPLASRIAKAYERSNEWDIKILTQYSKKGSLRDFVETAGKVEVSNLRSWILQILEGLDFLHRHHVVHSRISPDNIILDKTEGGTIVLKLADASYQHDLHQFSKDISPRFSTAESAYWIAPEIANKSQSVPAAPKDVWDVGVLVLQMAFGLDIQRQHNSPNNLMEAVPLSETFEDMITRIFKADPKKRPSAFELLPSGFLRDNDPVIESQSPESLTRIQSLSSSQTPVTRTSRSRHDSMHAHPAPVSRYKNDFEQINKLGKGGFGEVWRVRNRLEGTFYAIKKITQTSSASLTKTLHEVMLLSKLNNPFIVRYYATWIEDDTLQRPDGSAYDDTPASSSSEDLSDSLSQAPLSATQGLDFISSGGGFDNIEFGYDSDDSQAVESREASDTEEEDALKPPPAAMFAQRRRSSSSVPSKVTLYIQMEYCDHQTLRDLMKALHTDIKECWRLFRQILEGLAHVHANGVIHRDLKPENIFITLDESGSTLVRIGDFGLAKPGDASERGGPKGFADPRLTASIGTSFYVAPEVRSSGGGSYNAKADMYSLGIILFEMSYTLQTGMERASMLEALRKPDFELPNVFQEPDKLLQGQVIQSLVKHKASERPSSLELLRSGKIPSQAEDETIRNILQSFSDKSSPYYAKLIDGLFSQMKEAQSAREYTYDLGLTSYTPEDLMLQHMLQSILVDVFRRHGGLESSRQTLLPNTRHYESAVRLLDSSGGVVQLNYDLTYPFSRTLAKQGNMVGKFYSFGNVYREAPKGQHPRTNGEVDFDIVTGNSLDLALREAEIIKVVDEVFDSLPSFASSSVVYHITHSRLVDAILTVCGITIDNPVKQIISKLNIGQWTWTRIRNELRSLGVRSTSLDDLAKFNFRNEYKEAIPQLRALLQDTEELESTFRHLEAVCTYLERFRVKRKVYISPLSSHNERFYRGNLLFQTIWQDKRRIVLCAGGRYDRLIQEHQVGSSKGNTHAVGFNLAWENLLESMKKYQKKPSGKPFLKKTEEERAVNNSSDWKEKRCDVVIDSVDPAILRTKGIKVVQDLWANGINAELVIDTNIRESTSFQQQNRDDSTICHDWIVLIKQDETLRVRSGVSKEDVEIRSSELVGMLKSEIRERDRQEGKMDASRSYGPQTLESEREAEVFVLVAQHRGKKANRRLVIEDAHARTAELTSNFLSCPIIAVEMKDDLFDAAQETRLSDPDSWRRYIQGAPLTERQYLTDLHNWLLEKAQEGKNDNGAFLYNFRTRACFYYYLGTEQEALKRR